MIDALIKNGYDINSVDSAEGKTPLISASLYGNPLLSVLILHKSLTFNHFSRRS